MNYSNLALDLFDRAQRGKENSFALCWQTGLPGIARCGNIAGEVIMATGSFSSSDTPRIHITELAQPGKDNTYLFIDRKNDQAHFALLVDGLELLNSEAEAATGALSVIARQKSGKNFAIIAFWAPCKEGSQSSFLLAGSDDDFISFAISCSRFMRESV